MRLVGGIIRANIIEERKAELPLGVKMELIIYVIGFLVCYFVFDFSWWMSLLIALVAPIIFSLVVPLISIPIIGISTLIDKIKEHRRKPYPETTWEADYEAIEPWEEEKIPQVIKAERFIMDTLERGAYTRAELNQQGELLGYSEATIGRALNSLLEDDKIERIARGVYSKVGSLSSEGPMTYETTKVPITQTQPTLSMLAELEKERKRQSNTLGIWSLVLGLIGIFIGPVAVAAIVLGALQFKRHVSKCSIAGLILGIVGVILWIAGLVGPGPAYIPPVYPV